MSREIACGGEISGMSATQERTETLEERVARLEVRLQEGFSRIGEAMSKGVAPEHWEVKWVELLREYENIEDILREGRERARLEQSAMELGVREVRDA